jgi:hypothetical protein
VLRQAYELRVRSVDRHRGDELAGLGSRGSGAEPIYHANQVPPRRERHGGRFGMNALACHDVGQTDTRGQHLHPHFTILRLGALFINHPTCIESAVVSDDDARVSHDPRFTCRHSGWRGVACQASGRARRNPARLRRVRVAVSRFAATACHAALRWSPGTQYLSKACTS